MKLMAWIFLILLIVFFVFYTVDYYNMPKLENISKSTSCLTSLELKEFGLFKKEDYSIYIPKDWPFVELNAGSKNTYSFGISDNEYEFLSIWSGDYNKDAESLLIDTIKPLSNYTINNKTKIKTENGTTLEKANLTFKVLNETYNQNIYTYKENNKAYLILIRTNQYNTNNFENIINKIICSFDIN